MSTINNLNLDSYQKEYVESNFDSFLSNYDTPLGVFTSSAFIEINKPPDCEFIKNCWSWRFWHLSVEESPLFFNNKKITHHLPSCCWHKPSLCPNLAKSTTFVYLHKIFVPFCDKNIKNYKFEMTNHHINWTNPISVLIKVLLLVFPNIPRIYLIWLHFFTLASQLTTYSFHFLLKQENKQAL